LLKEDYVRMDLSGLTEDCGLRAKDGGLGGLISNRKKEEQQPEIEH